MTRKEAIEAIKFGRCNDIYYRKEYEEAVNVAIKALEQEPRKDEVILTKEEYGELVSSEFDIGYTKGYTEALEQNDVLDKIRAEIEQLTITEGGDDYVRKMAELFSLKMKVLQIIDKYNAESEI